MSPRWALPLDRLCRRRTRDDRGVVAIVVALVACFVIIPLAALAVDIGVQRVARRDAQAVADLVALDLARQLDGRKYSAVSATIQELADKSAARNSGGVGGDELSVVVELGTLDETKWASDPDGYFTKTTNANVVPNAVRVYARSAVGFTLGGGGSGGVVRSAIASASAQACFKLGTFALGLASNQSALNGLIGNALGIGVLGYNGLANSNISLLGLTSQLGAGTPDELLDLDDLTIGQLVDASAVVLSNTTPHDAADVLLLQAIRAQLSSGGVSGRLVDLGELIDIGTGGGSGLDANLNLLDLISGAAFVANGDAAIAVPNLALTLPGVASLTTRLRVIETPRMACYGGTARTGQVRLTIDGTLSAGIPLVLTVSGPIHIDLGLAVASGTLNNVTCVDGSPQSISINVAEQSAASTSLTLGNPDATPPTWINVRALGILGPLGPTIPLVNAGVSTVQSPVTGTYTLDPWDDYITTPYHTPQTPTSLPNFTAAAGLLGIPLGGLLNPLLNQVLNPLVTAVNSLITGTLAPALGLKVAGVDLFSVDNPGPNCAAPRLAG